MCQPRDRRNVGKCTTRDLSHRRSQRWHSFQPGAAGTTSRRLTPSGSSRTSTTGWGNSSTPPSWARLPTCAIDAPWTPLADISETDDAYVIEAELPGVTKDNLKVELNDRELVISGEIPMQEEEKEKEKEKRLRRRRTRRTGRFELRTLLPGDVNPDAVTANLSDGVLTVRVPKAQAAKPRRVEITG